LNWTFSRIFNSFGCPVGEKLKLSFTTSILAKISWAPDFFFKKQVNEEHSTKNSGAWCVSIHRVTWDVPNKLPRYKFQQPSLYCKISHLMQTSDGKLTLKVASCSETSHAYVCCWKYTSIIAETTFEISCFQLSYCVCHSSWISFAAFTRESIVNLP
jgi:hypothetical protein